MAVLVAVKFVWRLVTVELKRKVTFGGLNVPQLALGTTVSEVPKYCGTRVTLIAKAVVVPITTAEIADTVTFSFGRETRPVWLPATL